MAKSKTYAQEVGERLELLRAAMDMENQYIAERIGVTPQDWGHYKSGRVTIPPSTAIKLCILTGATTDFIYWGQRGAISGVLTEKLSKIEGGAKSSSKKRA